MEKFRLRVVTPQCKELHDRQQDIWEPLLAIADLVAGTWPAYGRGTVVALSGRRDQEDAEDGSIGIALLRDIK
ncbi:MAG: DUF3631 domain-containing protein, partial [Candidatus Eremiobacteraeota bacterium]|nr:DUF3631 domain-containing protein [Candidatus Eremiobacteraeota bacterium]